MVYHDPWTKAQVSLGIPELVKQKAWRRLKHLRLQWMTILIDKLSRPSNQLHDVCHQFDMYGRELITFVTCLSINTNNLYHPFLRIKDG